MRWFWGRVPQVIITTSDRQIVRIASAEVEERRFGPCLIAAPVQIAGVVARNSIASIGPLQADHRRAVAKRPHTLEVSS